MSKWKDALSAGARRLGLKLSPGPTPGAKYEQPFEIIPGMLAATEPCTLLEKWSAAAHPRYAIGQVKANGIRAVYLQTRVISRNAQPLDCALHCLPALVQLEKAFGEPMVIDCEYVEPAGFNATLTAHKRGWGVGTVFVFDAVPYSEWKRNTFTQPLRDRLTRLAEAMEVMGQTPFEGECFLQMLPGLALRDAEDARRWASMMWQMGLEGIVVKNANGLYTRGRSADWLKLKREQTIDVSIHDVVLDAADKGRVKTLLVRLPSKRIAKIGQGIPDNLRSEIAVAPGSWTGRMCEIGYTDTTETGALVGGHFVRMREDLDGGVHA